MLFERLILDLVDPFLVGPIFLLESLVVVIEACLIYLLMERSIVKAFGASFCANLITGLLSIIYFFLPLEFGFAYTKMGVDAFILQDSTLILLLVAGFLVNILVEAGVLKLFYRQASARRIFKVSAIMNVISYVLIVLNFVLFVG